MRRDGTRTKDGTIHMPPLDEQDKAFLRMRLGELADIEAGRYEFEYYDGDLYATDDNRDEDGDVDHDASDVDMSSSRHSTPFAYVNSSYAHAESVASSSTGNPFAYAVPQFADSLLNISDGGENVQAIVEHVNEHEVSETSVESSRIAVTDQVDQSSFSLSSAVIEQIVGEIQCQALDAQVSQQPRVRPKTEMASVSSKARSDYWRCETSSTR